MNKQTLLLVGGLFVLSVFSLKAQTTNQGTVFFGAQLTNINASFQKGSTEFDLGISPKIAFFIKDNIAVGAQLGIGVHSNKTITDVNYYVGPLARYYFNDSPVDFTLNHRALLFLEGSVGLLGENHHVKGSTNTHTNGLGIGVGPGLVYFISPDIGLETSLTYNLGVGFGNSTTTHQLGLNLGFNIYLPSKFVRNEINKSYSK
jgi:hypothetical protein